jgi:hypothetical protein
MIQTAAKPLPKALSIGLALTLAASVGWAQQPKTEKLVLTLTTRVQALPFKMPAIPNMPKIPGLADLGAPQRNITGLATYPTQAVDPMFVAVPADLKLAGNKLVLTVPKPIAAPGGAPGGGTTAQPGGTYQITSKLYWHPDEAQGPIESTAQIDTSRRGPRGSMAAPRILQGLPGQDVEKTATGEESKLPATVVGSGQYVLNTGGTATLDGFLPPIKVGQPESLQEVDLTQGIEVEWEAVAGAKGYILHAMGMTGQPGQVQGMTIIQWVSTLQEPPERVRTGYEQETTIDDDVANGVLLPPTAISCKVPPGIFPADLGTFILTVTAVGNDFYSTADGIIVRGKIRSEWTGMKTAGMPAMPAMPGGAGEE